MIAASIDHRGPCADRSSPDRRSIEVDDHDRRERKKQEMIARYLFVGVPL